jgi:hypothetical protein
MNSECGVRSAKWGRPLIPAFSPGGGEGVGDAIGVWVGAVDTGAVGCLDVAAGPCGLPPETRAPGIGTSAEGVTQCDSEVTQWCNQATQGDEEVTRAGLEISGLRGLRRIASHAIFFRGKAKHPNAECGMRSAKSKRDGAHGVRRLTSKRADS